MRVTYIYHSGYVIEAQGFAVLIDFYKDTSPVTDRGFVQDDLLKRPEPLYVLSSHFHPDHFNHRILRWKQHKDNIRYVFSKDILEQHKAKAGDALYLNKGDAFSDENLTIKAFGSTDIGVSFLLEVNGKRLFHAGDLNNWHWKDESDPGFSEEAEQFYLRELDEVAQAADHLDLAMFPVDPRLGTDFDLGAKQFIDRIPTAVFAPMHFGEWYDKLLPFGKYAEQKGVRFISLAGKGQAFDI